MNKRLLKRHKRQVARAKEVKPSEPDVKTLEQLAAAREASRAVTSRRDLPRPHYSTPAPKRAGTGAARADVDS